MNNMDKIDRDIINLLQKGFPLSDEPYAEVARSLGISETTLLSRLETLLQQKTLTRFGPMFDAQKLGGTFSLVAMKVPEQDFGSVCDIVNGYSEVAYNYQRDHDFNMWFVLATETFGQIDEINRDIELRTGLKTFNLPKLNEYYIGLNFSV